MTGDLFPDAPVERFRLSRRRRNVIEVLRRCAEKGRTLAEIISPRITNRKLATLKRYCREASIAFPDYVPRHMKPKRSKATSRAASRIRRARKRALQK